MKRLTVIWNLTVTLTILGIASCFPPDVSAQDSSVSEAENRRQWSLHECMIYALEHSPEIKIEQAANENYRINRREAALSFIPSISASTSGTASFGRMIDPETNMYTNTTTYSNSYGLSANMDIFNGLSLVNNLRIAKTAMLMGLAQEQVTKDNICLNVIQAYYNVLYNQGLVDLTAEQLEESRKALAQARIQLELGLKSSADVLQIEADVAGKEHLAVQARNSLAYSLLTLKSQMYFPMDQDLDVVSLDTSALPGNTCSAPMPDSLVAAALEFLPALKIENFKVRSAALELQTARWSLVPRIYAQGGYSTGYVYDVSYPSNTPFWDQLNAKQGQYVGIGISIPIFNGLYKYNQIARKRNALTTAEATRDLKYREVEVEIRKAVQDMQGAAAEYFSADKRAEALAQAHRANTRRYEEGLLSVLDLQTSSNNLLEARAAELDRGLQYLLKERIVMYYKGIGYLEQQ